MLIERHVALEKAVPKRRIVRSDGALYVLLLASVVLIIMAGNVLSSLWSIPRLPVQVALYAILLVIGYVVYRRCIVTFRYALTDRMLAVDRIVGRKERSEENVHLLDIVAIHPLQQARGALGKCRGLYVNSKRDALAVTVQAAGKRYTILMSPSEEFAGKLMAQWKTARKK